MVNKTYSKTYYCVVNQDVPYTIYDMHRGRTPIKAGIYAIYRVNYPLFAASDIIYSQAKYNNEIRVEKDRHSDYTGIITAEEALKKFMWVKLQAEYVE